LDAPQVQVAEPTTVTDPSSATAVGPANREEADLCRAAGQLDWAYLGAMVLADAGAIVLDSQVLQSSGQAGVRLLGPGLVGLSWGWTVGGAYLTLPQCSTDFARTRPAEGDTRSVWPLTLSFTLLAAATAPVVVGVETGEGNGTLQWSTTERAMRLVIASATGVVGSVMPYVLPPRTWRALRKLDRLRAGATAHGAVLSYAVVF
jgi:hypothetical protein